MCLPYFESYLENHDYIEHVEKNISNTSINGGILSNLRSLKLIFDSLRSIYNDEGYWGLYRGFIPMTLHSYFTRMLHDQLLNIYRRYCTRFHYKHTVSTFVKNSTKYVAEFITYPLLLISTQQAIFDVKRYNLSLKGKDKINESVVGVFSLIQLSISSEDGISSLWKGITAHITLKIMEDLIKSFLYSYLSTKIYCASNTKTRAFPKTIRSNNKKRIKHGIGNLVTSVLSPLALISTVKRCQSNGHNGMCRGNVGIKEILENVNWGIYFGQIVVNSVFIAVFLFEGENLY
ncbi:mitochondrial FAD carrier protein [Cryptosporidium canis]|uniref:Mitochondrial FAD carrier protein n=1 Tax=Cryptosporidium canis TaxID=195482 RepID=A0A9D5HZ06_9CRYT|nr:mitochondrial FAD carrier protein [Cryptosporidium canis]